MSQGVKGTKTLHLRTCAFCKKEILINTFESRKKIKYCSRICASKVTKNGFKKGNDYGKFNFKGGFINKNDGYKVVRGKREHRVVIGKKLGRNLTKNEVVHHKNHKRTDNRLENLILLSKAEHIKIHQKESKKIKRRCSECQKSFITNSMVNKKICSKKCRMERNNRLNRERRIKNNKIL